ncbi:MAG: hypothetical protein A2V87_11965 [Deltaproteobacteria bacterium RBG_16_58_17]|nr:MAG: hypothetical protein A2V87_11965 [Deltaproteobacteria bacterium RBG_16_58_17]OHE18022.1 MAG: hypothetical protein A2X96_11820 [Syntrophobacterales bacterium GWC2_56_13]
MALFFSFSPAIFPPLHRRFINSDNKYSVKILIQCYNHVNGIFIDESKNKTIRQRSSHDGIIFDKNAIFEGIFYL